MILIIFHKSSARISARCAYVKYTLKNIIRPYYRKHHVMYKSTWYLVSILMSKKWQLSHTRNKTTYCTSKRVFRYFRYHYYFFSSYTLYFYSYTRLQYSQLSVPIKLQAKLNEKLFSVVNFLF
jgi:hypothetical protein